MQPDTPEARHTGARLENRDKAGKDYWNRQWASQGDCSGAKSRLLGYRKRKQLDYLRPALIKHEAAGKEILELGCANSEWLPRFAKEFGMRVAGLDYSEQGCEMAREILRRNHVPGEIYCADMFHPPEELRNRFDFIASFGLVEHFEDLTNCLSATAQFLKPGGIAFTCIPNLAGLIGLAQKWLGPRTYAVHMPWKRDELTSHLAAAGFNVLDASYVMLNDFAACHVDETGGGFSRASRLAAYKWLKRFTALAMIAESKTGLYPLNRWTASYIFTTAQKPR